VRKKCDFFSISFLKIPGPEIRKLGLENRSFFSVKKINPKKERKKERREERKKKEKKKKKKETFTDKE
jgi:prophage tail gpP-like protein